jgi:redox-sensing transcriptional repressor
VDGSAGAPVPADGVPGAAAERAPDSAPERGIPEATVARLPIYLRALISLSEHSIATCSSEELATAAGVNSAKLRKDLSYLGSYGTRGVGYDVEYLRYQIAREIGVTQDWPVVIVGIGNLGHALSNYAGFRSRGFRIVALLDSDPARHGEQLGDLTIRSLEELEDLVAEHRIAIGVIATPAASAQQVCDRLVAAGVTSILNFAPAVLSTPDGVDLRKVDLSIELQILAYHEQRKALATRGAPRGVNGAAVPAASPTPAAPAAPGPPGPPGADPRDHRMGEPA